MAKPRLLKHPVVNMARYTFVIQNCPYDNCHQPLMTVTTGHPNHASVMMRVMGVELEGRDRPIVPLATIIYPWWAQFPRTGARRSFEP